VRRAQEDAKGGDPGVGAALDGPSDSSGRAGPGEPRGAGGLSVWALEPYFAGSHKAYLEGLAHHSRHRLVLLTLPGRNWKWRMHGGALSLARMTLERQAATGEAPQVLFASDMLDLPVFLAAVAPNLGQVPAFLYFHENQLTYPLPAGVERDLSYGFKNLASALMAEAVFFNSEFHRREFLRAVGELLQSMPDEVPGWVSDEVEARSAVLPLGCDLRRFDVHRARALAELAAGRWGDPAEGPLLLWNQRWEYDKAPGDLFKALYALKAAGIGFRLAMAGPNQGTPTAEFLRAKEELAANIVQWGKVEGASDYASLLWAADVVVSTAIHEFFGVAVVEAVYCGCRPVLPERLSYPELIPAEVHREVLYREGELVTALDRALAEPRAWSEDWQRTWVARFDWGTQRDRHDEAIRRCWESAARRRAEKRPERQPYGKERGCG
jgi:glycosyltransferase involved in cell wall biosynthesis